LEGDRGAVAQQAVRALTALAAEGTGNREHLAVEVERVLDGRERTALRRRLHDQNGLGERGNDPVAAHEIRAVGRRPGEKLAEQEAVPRDLLVQRFAGRWIRHVNAGAQYAHGATVYRQRTAMRGGVDAERHSAHDGHTEACDA